MGDGPRSWSPDGNERDQLVAVVPRDASGLGIRHGSPIDDEKVSMKPLLQFQSGHPTTVEHPMHRGSSEVPSVEITHQSYALSPPRIANEIHAAARRFFGVPPLELDWTGFTNRKVHGVTEKG